ncbi:MAG TPA: aldo/keto reductase [Rhodanobacter sp.]|nr:aldo/keto reductase [Rhodanobacter sp.]
MNTSTHRGPVPGLTICPVVMGLWQVADLERGGRVLDSTQAALAMKAYFDAGLTTFDMADHYGSAEDIAGVFRSRFGGDKTQLLTKWVPSPGPITKQDVRAAVQKSLRRLQAERIDLLQFHAWNYADPMWLDCLYWLHELKAEGLIAQLGLTNFNTAHLEMIVRSGIEIASNQVCYSLLDQRAAGPMTAACLRHGVKLLAFGTVAGGFLSGKWLDRGEPPLDESLTWSQMKYKRYIDTAGGWQKFQALLRVLHEVSLARGMSLANVASRYILEQPGVAGVIVGARLGQSEHIAENKALLEQSLDDADKEKIQAALKELERIPGDCGDEYRKPPFLTASGDLSHHMEAPVPPYPSQAGANGRQQVLTGTAWEEIAGYSRALRVGDRILVSGTTATHGARHIGGADPASQTHFVIDKIEGAIQSLGGSLQDVVRTRVFVKNIADWEAIARVHGERFRGIQPVNTMVGADLVGDEYVVEMEAEAVLSRTAAAASPI